MPPLEADMLRQILESLPVGVSVVDLNRRILFWNAAAEHITGHLAQEVIGRACRDEVLAHCGALGTPVCSGSSCVLACTLRSHQSVEASLFARHKDGHRVPVRVKSLPLYNPGGEIEAIAEVFELQHSPAALGSNHEPGPEANDGLNLPSIGASEAYLHMRLEAPGQSGIFIVAIEDIRELARQRGLEMVHTMMRALVQTLGEILEMAHFIGRWHNRSLLIVVPGVSPPMFTELLAQLRGLSNSLSVLWWGDRIASTVSVRGAIVRDHDSLRKLLDLGEPDLPEDSR
ncbi:MAG TPA: PAS domain-containing protein [Terriglobales bacterium]|nr:PAS domain-containing protein [Terriglobales bacterium]